MPLRPSRRLPCALLILTLFSLAWLQPGSAVADRAAGRAADVLLSRGKPTLTSSIEDSTLTGAKAVDGDLGTRWASAEGHDPEWIRVDLGAAVAISRVRLNWEDAYASSYRIDISTDGSTWTSAYSTSSGDGGIDDRAITATARYVRMYGRARGTDYGYSLWEFEVYGAQTGPDTTAPSVPGNSRVTATTATSVSLAWDASTDNVGVTGYDVLRDGTTAGTATGTSFTDTGLTTGTAYTYTIKARDAAGNVSAASTPVTGTPQPAPASFVYAGAGDISEFCKASGGSSCPSELTARRIEAINPAEVITMGDLQYDSGTFSEFSTYYATTWGRFKNKTRPVPGNHEWDDDPPAAGYKQYFGTRATPNGKTWYSWDRGNWHFVALDSDDSMSSSSPQITWLKNDLATNTKPCVAALWHKPLYSSGPQADRVSLPAWQALYNSRADLILNGHDHLYERFAPQNPSAGADANGIRELIVGTGGAGGYDFESPQPNSQKRITGVYAVIKLTFTDSAYTGQLVKHDGTVLDSFGPVTCH